MKKIIMTCFITVLLTSSCAFAMLLQKTLRAQKSIRMYRMQPLPPETIFNTTNKDLKHQLELLGDLYERNAKTIHDLQEQINLLQAQNNIANNTSYSYGLNIHKLKYLEIQIHEGFNDPNLVS